MPTDPANRGGWSKLSSMTLLLELAGNDVRFADVPHTTLSELLRSAVREARIMVGDGAAVPTPAALLDRAAALLVARRRGRLQAVVNATGVVLHTNLGRAPLAAAAIRAVGDVAAGYCNLEYDLTIGERGGRGGHIESLLRSLTNCEAALVVNNNAAATVLVLAALASGREVLVSRGQLIEIGGSYRLPEIMATGGAILREVGTTNRTRLADYERAINAQTAMIMRVHPSNFRLVGFCESPDAESLAALARARGIRFYDDLGSGALLDLAAWRAAGEPFVADSIRAGSDIVSFSGDKLLGGPQAGLIIGRAEAIARIREHPLARAVRLDKLSAAALQETLELYLCPDRATREIPTLAMLNASPASLQARSARLASRLSAACPGESFTVAEAESFAGGGSLPAWPMATWVVRWKPSGQSARTAADGLRANSPPVIVRIQDDTVLFDLRSVPDRDEKTLEAAVAACAATTASS